MAENLVVVESPTKARTLKKYLGEKYAVKASMGHVIDLPKSQFGVDVEDSFRPRYIIVKGKGKVLKEIKIAAKRAKRVYLASDPDREGEAIAWHIAGAIRALNGATLHRVILHEITAKKVKEAIEKPVELDERKFNAQQARRILDRVVGYKLSPLLWKKVKRGLSAGRVQSVAVRIIVDREKEIRVFVPIEYWSLTALLRAASAPPFRARLRELDGEKVAFGKPEAGERILLRDEIDALKRRLESGATFRVTDTESKDIRRHPPAPFITSELQREAARRYHYPARKTMMIAQQLYEGIPLGDEGPVGLITYMRTDSVRVSEDAVKEARAYIEETFSPTYLPGSPRSFRNKKNAQDAHEAIRPSDVRRTPEAMASFLNEEQLNVYRIVWQRMLASQMAEAVIAQTRVDAQADLPADGAQPRKALFRATGSTLKFDGFMTLYRESQDEDETSEDETDLPAVRAGEPLTLTELEERQHFTQPPPRYSESSLIKELEDKGIGRPSTYAMIISTIQNRGYVYKLRGRFIPSPLGELITDMLTASFPEVLDVQFTAEMEEQLDRIEEGEADWVQTLETFYRRFEKALERAAVEMKTVRGVVEKVGRACPKCTKDLVFRFGPRGRFIACSGFPECRHTESLPPEATEAKPPEGSDVKEEKGGSDVVGVSG
ncbi:MAG: type I DNA topoisomerase [Nitrospirae bacterium]|nr:type I DNA topoisomerase [Nitrospirota bacterium]